MENEWKDNMSNTGESTKQPCKGTVLEVFLTSRAKSDSSTFGPELEVSLVLVFMPPFRRRERAADARRAAR
jgi:hypothetical protein